jgi:hypothetical protein
MFSLLHGIRIALKIESAVLFFPRLSVFSCVCFSVLPLALFQSYINSKLILASQNIIQPTALLFLVIFTYMTVF